MERAALVIGINYNTFPLRVPLRVIERAGINPLRYAEADARDLATILQEAGYNVVSLLGPAATRRAIIEALRKQRRVAEPDGLLVVYFSGHGDLDCDEVAYLLP